MFYSRWQTLLVIAICIAGVFLALPNVASQGWLRLLPFDRQIHLGLDLKGGSYLLLKVDVETAERERLEGVIDNVRRVLRTANAQYTNLRVEGGAIKVDLRDTSRVDDVRSLLRPIAGIGGTADYDIASTDAGEITLKPTEVSLRDRASDAVQRSIEIIRRRIDETGVNEPSIARQGTDRISVQLPGVQDPERLKRLLGTTAKLSFRLLSTSPLPASGTAPPGTEILPAGEGSQGPARYLVQRTVEVDGAHLKDARATTNSQTGEWIVSFEFDALGARQFAATTQNGVGRYLAIVLDNKVISAPVIREPILGGRGQISGHFTAASANDLAILLRGGALPAPLKIIEERTVGPNLGADDIRTGNYASQIGGAVVVFF